MMNSEYKNTSLKIFALNGNKPLAEEIAKVVGIPLGKSSVKRFSDGEVQINIEEVFEGVMYLSFNLLRILLTNA